MVESGLLEGTPRVQLACSIAVQHQGLSIPRLTDALVMYM